MIDQKQSEMQEKRSLYLYFAFHYCKLSVIIFLSLIIWYKCGTAYQDAMLAKHCKHHFQ